MSDISDKGFELSICIIYLETLVPFRRPYYRTSHCYSELSGDYWDKLSHPTITDIFAGIHAQVQASGRELVSRVGIVYLELYIVNL